MQNAEVLSNAEICMLDCLDCRRAGQMVGPLSQLVQPANLVAGVLYFGIYNMDYYVHSPFAYTLQVFCNQPHSYPDSSTNYPLPIAWLIEIIPGSLIWPLLRSCIRTDALRPNRLQQSAALYCCSIRKHETHSLEDTVEGLEGSIVVNTGVSSEGLQSQLYTLD